MLSGKGKRNQAKKLTLLVNFIVSIFQAFIWQAKLNKMTVDYPSIWREVSDSGFMGEVPVSEYDRASYIYLFERIQLASQLLRGGELSKDQRRRVRAKLRVLLARMTRVQTLARRVDASIPQPAGIFVKILKERLKHTQI